jgi:hypothetical protein
MSDLALYGDISSRKLVAADGGALSLAPMVLGDKIVCSLRVLERQAEAIREKLLHVRSLKASIGKVLTPPTSGGVTLTIGAETTGMINVTSSGAEVLTAFAAITGNVLAEVQASGDSTWLLRFTAPGIVAIETTTNTLAPRAFARVRAFLLNETWWHELRFVQAPVVFSGVHTRELPPPPSIERARAGAPRVPGTSINTNEVQVLTVPPEFRGTYYLRWDYRSTRLLGIEDGIDVIDAALEGMFTSGKAANRFEVSLPEDNKVHVEFVGPLAAAPQPLITVAVSSFAPGTLTFELDLSTTELAAALRTSPLVEMPFEVELEVVDSAEDLTDNLIPGRFITLFQHPVKLVREQIFEELATFRDIDWLSKPQPRSYIPFSPDSIAVGQVNYSVAFGNGAHTSFSILHNLGTDAISSLVVRENVSGGRILTVNAEFAALITGTNELTLIFPVAPALNSLAVTITGAPIRSVFLAHTHTIQEIIGLEAIILELGARLGSLEDLVAERPITITDGEEETPLEILIPEKSEVFPARKSQTASAKPRAFGLLPAIHDATITALTDPLASASASKGNVFQNTTGAAILLPAALGQRGVSVPINGHAGSDGRAWYPVTKAGATNSFFPTAFERELFSPLYISEKELRAGLSLELRFDLEIALQLADTGAQYMLVVLVGAAPSQATPAPTSSNLQEITWQATPVLEHRLILSELPRKHSVGINIYRSAAGALTAERVLYGAVEGGAQAPAAPNFVIGGRIERFDTDNNKVGNGLISYALSNGRVSIQ